MTISPYSSIDSKNGIFCKPLAKDTPQVSGEISTQGEAGESFDDKMMELSKRTLKDLMNISLRSEDAIEIMEKLETQKDESVAKFPNGSAIPREGFNTWRSRVAKIKIPGPIPPEMLFSLEDVEPANKKKLVTTTPVSAISETSGMSCASSVAPTTPSPSEVSAGQAKTQPEKDSEWGPEGRPRWVPKNGKQDPNKKPSPFLGRQMMFMKNTKTVFRKDAVWTVVGESGSGRSWRVDPGKGFGDHLEEKWKAIGATVPKKKEGQLWRWKEPTKMWMEKQGLPMSLLNEMKPQPFRNHNHNQFGAPRMPVKPLRTSAPAFTPQRESVGSFNRPVLPNKPSFAQALGRSPPKFPSSGMRSRSSTGLSQPTTPIENELDHRRKESEMRIIRMMMDQQELDRKELEMLRRELSGARAEIDRLRRGNPRSSTGSHSHRSSRGSPLRGPIGGNMGRSSLIRRPEGNKVHAGQELVWAPTRNTPSKEKKWEMWGAKRLAAKPGQ